MAYMQQLIRRGAVSVRAIPAVVALPRIHKRDITEIRRGGGGRSSFSGVVATVFGATGFYGRYVVNRLGRVGSQVVIPFRGDEHDYRHLTLMGDLGQLTFKAYHLKDANSVAKVVKYSNVVINLVGRDYETRNFSFNDAHVTGARVIAEACKQAGVERLIHFSALGASSTSPSSFLQSKAKGEEAVREVFPNATIIRPAVTYGNEDRFFNYYANLRTMPMGMVPMMNHGLGVYKHPVAVIDIAMALMNVIGDPTTNGKTYEFAGPTRYELLDLVHYLYRVMYRPFKPWAPPNRIFRLVAWMLEQSPFPPYLTRDMLTRQHLSEELTPGLPGLEDVGVSPVSVEETALTYLRRYRDAHHYSKSVDEVQPLTK